MYKTLSITNGAVLIILVTGCSALIPPTPKGRLVATLRLTAVILMSIIKLSSRTYNPFTRIIWFTYFNLY